MQAILGEVSAGVKSRSVMSDSLQSHGLHGTWNSQGQITGMGTLSLLQGIFPTQESNQGFLHCRRILYKLRYLGSLNWGSVAEKRIDIRGWSQPRSHPDPQDSCQVWALGFVQERIQERNNRVKEGFIHEDTHSVDKQWAVSEDKRDSRIWGCHLLWEVGVTQSNEWEEYCRYFGEGVGISRNLATIYFLTFIIMVQVDVSFSLLMCQNDHHILRLKVWWKSTCLTSWTCLAQISLYCVLGLCHSFRDCALPPSVSVGQTCTKRYGSSS